MATQPPFRADQVGSLLRPPELREARAKARAGALAPAQLNEVEDRCIRAAVARQESIGLRAVTDGEYRRDFWHLDFMSQLDGVGTTAPVGMVFQADDVPPMATITAKVRCSKPIMLDHFTFLKSVATATPKLTIPSPAMLHMRGGRNAVSSRAYPDLAEFWRDAAAAYRTAIGHLGAAGCSYLQLDDVSWAYLCDPNVRDNFLANGDDPATLPRIYADLINDALAERPAGMASDGSPARFTARVKVDPPPRCTSIASPERTWTASSSARGAGYGVAGITRRSASRSCVSNHARISRALRRPCSTSSGSSVRPNSR